MIIKTVNVQYSRKITSNFSKYPIGEAEVSLWADLLPTEDVGEAMERLWEMATANVHHQALKALGKEDEAEIRYPILGLPPEGETDNGRSND